MKDDALTTCPEDACGKKRWGKGKVKRAMGAGAGLIFKGSGFYITDYRSDSYKQAAKKDTAGGDAKPATPAKSDSPAKPAASTKSESKSPKSK
jgi:predicted nucleic acid-binding Zn ribbon protein